MTSCVQNRVPFWCTALKYSEACLPPYEAAVEHGAYAGMMNCLEKQTKLIVPQAALKPPLTNKRETKRDSQNLTVEQQAIRKC